MFAFVELPKWLDTLMQEYVGFPGFDQGLGETAELKSNIYINALHLRWIGYTCLALVMLFIILGFTTKKSGWAWAGAFTLFLPVFGQFALSMFFLSGLGILRAAWLPFMDISWSVLDLGQIIYIPYWILIWFCSLINWYAHDFISWFFMATGAFLFVWGVMAWFQVRFGQQKVATGWIYKFSRHPQYLGWIIWSYGMMLFSSGINDMKKSWGVGSSLPWLLMTMIIIGICLIEEIKMNENSGEEYESYRNKTPFLFPIPKWLKNIIKAPAKIFIRKDRPENTGDAAGVITIYTVILILISLIWVDFENETTEKIIVTEFQQQQLDSLIMAINSNTTRRTMYHQFEELEKYGNTGIEVLIQYLKNPNPDKREFAVQVLGNLKAVEATGPIALLLDDPQYRVRNTAVIALGKIGSDKALKILFDALKNPAYIPLQDYLISALADHGVKEAWPYALRGLKSEQWYHRNAALRAMMKLEPDKSLDFVFQALKDENYRIRRNAVELLLEYKPPEAIEPLREVMEDEDYETRFYAKQAIKLIEEEQSK